MSTPALWTLLAPCANISRMTAVAPEAAAPVEDPAAVVAADDSAAENLVLADMLVEEISIDGMCGVY
jgi:mycofactocin precursor